jgi:hypothetical protein
MQKRLLTSLLVIVPLALTGCVDTGETPVAGGPAGTLVVENTSPTTLTAVTISACDAFTHGFNDLPSGVVINPGESYAFAVAAGCTDVQAGYGTSTGYGVADFNAVNVAAGATVFLSVN